VKHLPSYVGEQGVRRKGGVTKAAVYVGLAVLLTAGSLLAANGGKSPVRSTPMPAARPALVVPQSFGCTVTFTNPGPPALTACVGEHGNINQIDYSPFGNPDNSSFDGYCLRDLGSGSTYWDIASADAGWGVATQSSTATTATTTRTTTDGRYTLTQNVFFKYGARMVLVGNLVRNNDTVAHSVTFDRVFFGDINGDSHGDVYDTAGGSVFAQDIDGVASTFLADPSLVARIGVSIFRNWVEPGNTSKTCQHAFAPTPTSPGTYVGIQQGRFTIPPGASVNFRVGYRLL
jgi:hypothetical protein